MKQIFFMCTLRGRKIYKMTVSQVMELTNSREHVVLGYQTSTNFSNHVPQQSKLKLACLKCNYGWETKLQTYKERTNPHSGGCRNCWNQIVVNPSIYPNSPFIKRNMDVGRRQGIQKLRQIHSEGAYNQIKSRADLIDFLSKNSNSYNNLSLKLIKREDFGKTKLLNLPMSKHHVIPLHDSGSPDKWNLIQVTKEEHHLLHVLRFEIYQNPKDLYATYLTQADLIKYTQQTNPPQLNPNQNSSKTPLVISRSDKYGKQRVTKEAKFAMEKGMIWKHKDGFQIRIEPNSISSINELKNILIQNIPLNHPTQLQLKNSSSANNYLRAVLVTNFAFVDSVPISKPRTHVYGFTVELIDKY